MLERPSRVLLFTLLITSCAQMRSVKPDVHGHRGCRGTHPENSIPGFIKAVDLGCDYLELDVVLSGDDQVVISHEPWMSARICRTPQDEPITPDLEQTFNLFRMNILEIQQFDCGSAGHPDFPDQKKKATTKPTLREMVETVDEHALLNGHPYPAYNVEIKSHPDWYGIYQPGPDLLAERVVSELDALDLANRCIVQSFDRAVLRAIHAERDDFPLALLVENSNGLDADLEQLGFIPDIYSPHHSLVDAEMVRKVHELGMDLVIWTVNDEVDIRRILDLGVDGIISDHPERVFTIMQGSE